MRWLGAVIARHWQAHHKEYYYKIPVFNCTYRGGERARLVECTLPADVEVLLNGVIARLYTLLGYIYTDRLLYI